MFTTYRIFIALTIASAIATAVGGCVIQHGPEGVAEIQRRARSSSAARI